MGLYRHSRLTLSNAVLCGGLLFSLAASVLAAESLQWVVISNGETVGTLDVQRDHVTLIGAAAGRLATDGVLIFSNHSKQFRMDSEALSEAGLGVENITRETLPRDFARKPRTHSCWRIRRH